MESFKIRYFPKMHIALRCPNHTSIGNLKGPCFLSGIPTEHHPVF